MRRIAILAICLGLFAGPALAQSKAAIQKLEDQWGAAFNKGDAAAVAAMYTEDAHVLPAGDAMVKGRAAIEALFGLRQVVLAFQAKKTIGEVPGNHGR